MEEVVVHDNSMINTGTRYEPHAAYLDLQKKFTNTWTVEAVLGQMQDQAVNTCPAQITDPLWQEVWHLKQMLAMEDLNVCMEQNTKGLTVQHKQVTVFPSLECEHAQVAAVSKLWERRAQIASNLRQEFGSEYQTTAQLLINQLVKHVIVERSIKSGEDSERRHRMQLETALKYAQLAEALSTGHVEKSPEITVIPTLESYIQATIYFDNLELIRAGSRTLKNMRSQMFSQRKGGFVPAYLRQAIRQSLKSMLGDEETESIAQSLLQIQLPVHKDVEFVKETYRGINPVLENAVTLPFSEFGTDEKFKKMTSAEYVHDFETRHKETLFKDFKLTREHRMNMRMQILFVRSMQTREDVHAFAKLILMTMVVKDSKSDNTGLYLIKDFFEVMKTLDDEDLMVHTLEHLIHFIPKKDSNYHTFDGQVPAINYNPKLVFGTNAAAANANFIESSFAFKALQQLASLRRTATGITFTNQGIMRDDMFLLPRVQLRIAKLVNRVLNLDMEGMSRDGLHIARREVTRVLKLAVTKCNKVLQDSITQSESAFAPESSELVHTPQVEALLFTPLILKDEPEVEGSVIAGFAKRLSGFITDKPISYKDHALSADWKAHYIRKYFQYQPPVVTQDKTALDEQLVSLGLEFVKEKNSLASNSTVYWAMVRYIINEMRADMARVSKFLKTGATDADQLWSEDAFLPQLLEYFKTNHDQFKVIEHLTMVELFAMLFNGTEAAVEFAKTQAEQVLDISCIAFIKQPISYDRESVVLVNIMKGYEDVMIRFDLQHLFQKVPKISELFKHQLNFCMRAMQKLMKTIYKGTCLHMQQHTLQKRRHREVPHKVEHTELCHQMRHITDVYNKLSSVMIKAENTPQIEFTETCFDLHSTVELLEVVSTFSMGYLKDPLINVAKHYMNHVKHNARNESALQDMLERTKAMKQLMETAVQQLEEVSGGKLDSDITYDQLYARQGSLGKAAQLCDTMNRTEAISLAVRNLETHARLILKCIQKQKNRYEQRNNQPIAWIYTLTLVEWDNIIPVLVNIERMIQKEETKFFLHMFQVDLDSQESQEQYSPEEINLIKQMRSLFNSEIHGKGIKDVELVVKQILSKQKYVNGLFKVVERNNILSKTLIKTSWISKFCGQIYQLSYACIARHGPRLQQDLQESVRSNIRKIGNLMSNQVTQVDVKSVKDAEIKVTDDGKLEGLQDLYLLMVRNFERVQFLSREKSQNGSELIFIRFFVHNGPVKLVRYYQALEGLLEKLSEFFSKKLTFEPSEDDRRLLRLICCSVHDTFVHSSAILTSMLDFNKQGRAFNEIKVAEDCPEMEFDNIQHLFANHFNRFLHALLDWNDDSNFWKIEKVFKSQIKGFYFKGNTLKHSLLKELMSKFPKCPMIQDNYVVRQRDEARPGEGLLGNIFGVANGLGGRGQPLREEGSRGQPTQGSVRDPTETEINTLLQFGFLEMGYDIDMAKPALQMSNFDAAQALELFLNGRHAEIARFKIAQEKLKEEEEEARIKKEMDLALAMSMQTDEPEEKKVEEPEEEDLDKKIPLITYADFKSKLNNFAKRAMTSLVKGCRTDGEKEDKETMFALMRTLFNTHRDNRELFGGPEGNHSLFSVDSPEYTEMKNEQVKEVLASMRMFKGIPKVNESLGLPAMFMNAVTKAAERLDFDLKLHMVLAQMGPRFEVDELVYRGLLESFEKVHLILDGLNTVGYKVHKQDKLDLSLFTRIVRAIIVVAFSIIQQIMLNFTPLSKKIEERYPNAQTDATQATEATKDWVESVNPVPLLKSLFNCVKLSQAMHKEGLADVLQDEKEVSLLCDFGQSAGLLAIQVLAHPYSHLTAETREFLQENGMSLLEMSVQMNLNWKVPNELLGLILYKEDKYVQLTKQVLLKTLLSVSMLTLQSLNEDSTEKTFEKFSKGEVRPQDSQFDLKTAVKQLTSLVNYNPAGCKLDHKLADIFKQSCVVFKSQDGEPGAKKVALNSETLKPAVIESHKDTLAFEDSFSSLEKIDQIVVKSEEDSQIVQLIQVLQSGFEQHRLSAKLMEKYVSEGKLPEPVENKDLSTLVSNQVSSIGQTLAILERISDFSNAFPELTPTSASFYNWLQDQFITEVMITYEGHTLKPASTSGQMLSASLKAVQSAGLDKQEQQLSRLLNRLTGYNNYMTMEQKTMKMKLRLQIAEQALITLSETSEAIKTFKISDGETCVAVFGKLTQLRVKAVIALFTLNALITKTSGDHSITVSPHSYEKTINYLLLRSLPTLKQAEVSVIKLLPELISNSESLIKQSLGLEGRDHDVMGFMDVILQNKLTMQALQCLQMVQGFITDFRKAAKGQKQPGLGKSKSEKSLKKNVEEQPDEQEEEAKQEDNDVEMEAAEDEPVPEMEDQVDEDAQILIDDGQNQPEVVNDEMGMEDEYDGEDDQDVDDEEDDDDPENDGEEEAGSQGTQSAPGDEEEYLAMNELNHYGDEMHDGGSSDSEEVMQIERVYGHNHPLGRAQQQPADILNAPPEDVLSRNLMMDIGRQPPQDLQLIQNQFEGGAGNSDWTAEEHAVSQSLQSLQGNRVSMAQSLPRNIYPPGFDDPLARRYDQMVGLGGDEGHHHGAIQVPAGNPHHVPQIDQLVSLTQRMIPLLLNHYKTEQFNIATHVQKITTEIYQAQKDKAKQESDKEFANVNINMPIRSTASSSLPDSRQLDALIMQFEEMQRNMGFDEAQDDFDFNTISRLLDNVNSIGGGMGGPERGGGIQYGGVDNAHAQDRQYGARNVVLRQDIQFDQGLQRNQWQAPPGNAGGRQNQVFDDLAANLPVAELEIDQIIAQEEEKQEDSQPAFRHERRRSLTIAEAEAEALQAEQPAVSDPPVVQEPQPIVADAQPQPEADVQMQPSQPAQLVDVPEQPVELTEAQPSSEQPEEVKQEQPHSEVVHAPVAEANQDVSAFDEVEEQPSAPQNEEQKQEPVEEQKAEEGVGAAEEQKQEEPEAEVLGFPVSLLRANGYDPDVLMELPEEILIDYRQEIERQLRPQMAARQQPAQNNLGAQVQPGSEGQINPGAGAAGNSMGIDEDFINSMPAEIQAELRNQIAMENRAAAAQQAQPEVPDIAVVIAQMEDPQIRRDMLRNLQPEQIEGLPQNLANEYNRMVEEEQQMVHRMQMEEERRRRERQRQEQMAQAHGINPLARAPRNPHLGRGMFDNPNRMGNHPVYGDRTTQFQSQVTEAAELYASKIKQNYQDQAINAEKQFVSEEGLIEILLQQIIGMATDKGFVKTTSKQKLAEIQSTSSMPVSQVLTELCAMKSKKLPNFAMGHKITSALSQLFVGEIEKNSAFKNLLADLQEEEAKIDEVPANSDVKMIDTAANDNEASHKTTDSTAANKSNSESLKLCLLLIGTLRLLVKYDIKITTNLLRSILVESENDKSTEQRVLKKHTQYLTSVDGKHQPPLLMILAASNNISRQDDELTEKIEATQDQATKKSLLKQQGTLKTLIRNLNHFIQDAFMQLDLAVERLQKEKKDQKLVITKNTVRALTNFIYNANSGKRQLISIGKALFLLSKSAQENWVAIESEFSSIAYESMANTNMKLDEIALRFQSLEQLHTRTKSGDFTALEKPSQQDQFTLTSEEQEELKQMLKLDKRSLTATKHVLFVYNSIQEKIEATLKAEVSSDAHKANLAMALQSLKQFYQSDGLIEHTKLLGQVLTIAQASSESEAHIKDLVQNIVIFFECFKPDISSLISAKEQSAKEKTAAAEEEKKQAKVDDKKVALVEINLQKQNSVNTSKALALFKGVDNITERLTSFATFCLSHKKVINKLLKSTSIEVLDLKINQVIKYMPNLLDFENKKNYFYKKLEQKKDRGPAMNLKIERANILEDAYQQINHRTTQEMRRRIKVQFKNEPGVDATGLTRDFFIELSKQMFAQQFALFTRTNNGVSYFPDYRSGFGNPHHLNYFRFIGKMVGKGIFDSVLLECHFARSLYKMILGEQLSFEDLEDFDNETFNNLKKHVLDFDVTYLELTYTYSKNVFDKGEDQELIPGGKDIVVTNENKHDYVAKYVTYIMYGIVKEQIDAFLEGFYQIIDKDLIAIFNYKELEILIAGLPTIDIADLKKHSRYQGYHETSSQIVWLFEILNEMDENEKAQFLQFVTGSSRVPPDGFSKLMGMGGINLFNVHRVPTQDFGTLPSAHTCFNQLDVPEYPSKEIMHERLLKAIRETEGFGFA